MFNGTETAEFFRLASLPLIARQGAFPESRVRHVYHCPQISWKFGSKYVWPGKGLKGSIKLDTSKFAFFCRAFPLSLWVGSLPALARGGMLCQLVID